MPFAHFIRIRLSAKRDLGYFFEFNIVVKGTSLGSTISGFPLFSSQEIPTFPTLSVLQNQIIKNIYTFKRACNMKLNLQGDN